MKKIKYNKFFKKFIIYTLSVSTVICSTFSNLYVSAYGALEGADDGVTYGDGTEKGLRAALYHAMLDLCSPDTPGGAKLIKKLHKDARIVGKKGNEKITMEKFFDNRYPYDTSDDTVMVAPNLPRIGDVQPMGYIAENTYEIDKYDKDYKALMDDVNYSEIMTVLCQSSEINAIWGTSNYDKFEEFIVSDPCKDYMYEIGLKWIPRYKGTKKTVIFNNGYKYEKAETVWKDGKDFGYIYDSPEECANAPETVTSGGITYKFVEFYIESKVKPFGLRELYKIAFPNTGPLAAYKMMNEDFFMHTNEFMLDHTELITRDYERGKMQLIKGTYRNVTTHTLGISYKEDRDFHSSIYEDLMNDSYLKEKHQEGKGRSAWFYIEKTYNGELEAIDWVGENLYEFDDIEDFELSDEEEKMLEELLANITDPDLRALFIYLFTVALGANYSQSYRDKEGFYDCSSLIERAFKEIGIIVSGNSSAQYAYARDNGLLIDKNNLKPGTVLYTKTANAIANGKAGGVGHCMIYIGGGKVIAASGDQKDINDPSTAYGKVKIQNVPSLDKIAGGAWYFKR